MKHLRPLSLLALLSLAAALPACQPETHSFVGYREDAFSMRDLRHERVAVLVAGGPSSADAAVEEAVGHAARTRDLVPAAKVRALLKEANLPEVRASDFAVMNSDYRTAPVEKALAGAVAQVRAKTQATYLVACVGWLDASKLEGRSHAWEASPLAGHVGSIKVYVLDVATGRLQATVHTVVQSPDAASGHVEIDSSKLGKGVWEDTAKEALDTLEGVR